MPLFFLISGYLYNASKYSDFSCFIKTKIYSLVVPLYVWSIIYLAYNYLYSIIGSNNYYSVMENIYQIIYQNNIYSINYIGTLWFIGCLFVVEIVFNRFWSIKSTFSSVAILIFISFCIGYLFKFIYDRYDFRPPFWIDIASVSICFYGAGFLLKNKFKTLIDYINKKIVIVVFCFLDIIFVIWNYWPYQETYKLGRVDMLYLQYNNYLLFFFTALSGIAIFFAFSLKIQNMKMLEKILSKLGKFSLGIMIVHIPIMKVMKHFINIVHVNNFFIKQCKVVVLFLCTIYISLILTRYLSAKVPLLFGGRK